MLRAVLAEIDALADKLSPARAEALLDEFQQDIASAFLRQDLSAVKANCEGYRRRFRTLAEEEWITAANVPLTDWDPWSTLVAPVLRLIPPRELLRRRPWRFKAGWGF